MLVIETPSLSVVYDTNGFEYDVGVLLGEDPSGSAYGLLPLGLRWFSIGETVLDSFELEIDGPNGDMYLAGLMFGFRIEELLAKLDSTGQGTCAYIAGGKLDAHLDGEDVVLSVGRVTGRGPYAAYRADIREVLYQVASFFEQQDRRCVDVDNEVGVLLRRWLTYRTEAPEPSLE